MLFVVLLVFSAYLFILAWVKDRPESIPRHAESLDGMGLGGLPGEMENALAEQDPELTRQVSRPRARRLRIVPPMPYLDDLAAAAFPGLKEPFDSGMQMMAKHKWVIAITQFEAAVPAARKSQLVALYSLVGVCRDRLGQEAHALAAFEASLNVAQEFLDLAGAARAYANIGLIFRDAGKLKPAQEYHEKALQIDTELGNQRGIAGDMANLGLICHELGELERAAENLVQARGAFHSLRMELEATVASRCLAGLSSEMGQSQFVKVCERYGLSADDATSLSARFGP